MRQRKMAGQGIMTTGGNTDDADNPDDDVDGDEDINNHDDDKYNAAGVRTHTQRLPRGGSSRFDHASDDPPLCCKSSSSALRRVPGLATLLPVIHWITTAASLALVAPSARGFVFAPLAKPPARPFGTCTSRNSVDGTGLNLAARASESASDVSPNITGANVLEPSVKRGAALVRVRSSLSNLTTYQATAAIRKFQDAGAHDSIVRFMKVAASPRNPAVYAAAISALCRDVPGDALELFHEMEAANVQPSSPAMEAVMTSIAGLYEGDVDTILFWQARLGEMYPRAWTDPRAWDATLSAIVDNNSNPNGFEACMALHRAMKQQEVELGTRTYQLLFHACADHGKGPAAEALLNDLLAEKQRHKLITSRLWSSVLRAFAAVADSAGCRRVLRMIVERGSSLSVHHYTFYIHSLLPDTRQMLEVLLHMSGDPRAAADELKGLPPVAPDAVSIKAALRLCGMVGDFDTAYEILAAVQRGVFGSAVKADEAMYNLVLAACSDSAEAKAVIREMRLTRRHRIGCIPPSLVSYTHAITACRRAADLASALLFLRLARVDGLTPDLYMYTAAVWASATARNVTAATTLLAEMQMRNCTPNEISYNGALDACASCGDAAEATRIYHEMIGRGLRPSGQTFQLLARSFRAEANATTRVNWLQSVYNTMNADQRSSDAGAPIADALIQGLASLNRFDDALQIFTGDPGPSDVSCLRSILSACSTATPPRWEEALSLLHASYTGSASGAPSALDPIALGYAMLACSKADHFEESLNLFQFYGGRDTPLAAINSLIGACGRRGRPDVAMMVLNDVDDRGVQLDGRSYRNAIVACNQGQHRTRRVATGLENEGGFEWWECAVSLIRRMKERGMQPDAQSYSSCISACETAGQWQAALSLLQSLMDEEDNQGDECSSLLNLHCFNAAISACAKGGAWVEALELYERMKARHDARIQPTAVTLGSLIEGLDRAGQKDLAKRIHLEGVRKKVINPWRRTRAGEGKTVLAMDLHSFTAAMARAAVRAVSNGERNPEKQGFSLFVVTQNLTWH